MAPSTWLPLSGPYLVIPPSRPWQVAAAKWSYPVTLPSGRWQVVAPKWTLLSSTALYVLVVPAKLPLPSGPSK